MYAHFGLTYYFAQVLERGLINALVYVHGPGPTQITRSQVDQLYTEQSDKTMGWVLSRLRQTNAPDELIGEIQNAVHARNWLAHQFFWDHAVDFNTETGCQRMLAELEAMRIQFEECTANIDKVVYRWLAAHGMGPEDVTTIAAKLLQDVDQEDSLPS